jgi:putative ABC transport system permease protein
MTRPPGWAEWFLARSVAHTDGANGIVAELREEFSRYHARAGRLRASIWFGGQVLVVGGPFILQRAYRAVTIGVAADLRHAVRGLLNSPGYATVALVSLVLGIGANTAAFSVINAILFRPLPYPDAERLVDIGEFHPEEVCKGCGLGASPPAYEAWFEHVPAFETLGASSEEDVIVDTGAERARLRAAAVDARLLSILGARALHGRLFDALDDPPTGDHAVVIGYGLWSGAFGRDSSIIGRSVDVGGVARVIVGVLPPDFRFLGRADLFVPLHTDSVQDGDRSLWVVGRLREGTTLALAQRQLDVVSEGLAVAAPIVFQGWRAIVQPLRASVLNEVGDPRGALPILMATVTVLLIACANLANVTSARSLDRRSQMVIRGALGASRARVLRYALAESVVLAAVGGAIGVGIAYGLGHVLESRIGPLLPAWIVFGVDGRLLGFALLVTVAATMIAGWAPARRASRVDLRSAMGAGGRTTLGPRAARFRNVVVAFQVGLSTVLLATAAYALSEYRRVSARDNLGYQPDGVTGVSVDLSSVDDPLNAAQRIAERLTALPGVTRTAVEQPRFVGTFGAASAPSLVRVEGRLDAVPNAVVPRHAVAVSPGYFALLHIPILRGRPFSREDARARSGVAVVNQLAAEVLWPGEDPLGRGLRIEDELNNGVLTVIGVASNVVISPLQASRRGHARIYTLHSESPGRTTDFLMRGTSVTRTDVVVAVREVEPMALVTELMTLNHRLSRGVSEWTIVAGVMTATGILALLLATIGIYGGLAHTVSHGVREIAIRVALGADRGSIRRLVSGRVLALCAGGLIMGVIGARTLGALQEATGLRVGASDPRELAVVALIVVAIGVLASARPLRRALRVAPSEILRDD